MTPSLPQLEVSTPTSEGSSKAAAGEVECVDIPATSVGGPNKEVPPQEPGFGTLPGRPKESEGGGFLAKRLQAAYPTTPINVPEGNRHSESENPFQKVRSSLPVTSSQLADDVVGYHGISGEPQTRIMDDPSFHEFLESIPESDPTTMQSLLPEKDSREVSTQQQPRGILTATDKSRICCIASQSTTHNNNDEHTNSSQIPRAWRLPSADGSVYVLQHKGSSHSYHGKRKLPSLQQMWNDDYHWDKAANWATQRRTVTWSHCFDARLEDLNVLIDLTHSIMFARTYPKKESMNSKRPYDNAFEHICFIKELVDSFTIDPSLRKHLESQYSGHLGSDKPLKGKPAGPPLSRLIDDIQTQLPSDTWTLNPTTYSMSPAPECPSLRLSEIVIILFLHHEYLREHTYLSPYEIYSLSMVFSDMFFDQISRHFKTGKIHTATRGSPMATDMAIDLGTLFLLVSYGPAHFRTRSIFNSTPGDSQATQDYINRKKVEGVFQPPRDASATNKSLGYILSELDQLLEPERSKSSKGRNLPFKAAALPDRWAFLKDYLSHWMDRVGLCSTEPSIVTSRLLLAHKLCTLELTPRDRSPSSCERLQQPMLPSLQRPNISQELSSVCRQLQDRWTPQHELDAIHGFLGDKRVLTWHLIALWWQDTTGQRRPQDSSNQQDLVEVSSFFPASIRTQLSSTEAFELQRRNLDVLREESPHETDMIQQEWRAISEDMSLSVQRSQELAARDGRGRQITMDSFLKRIWM
ncbi:hypothetical protein PG997_014867 [Apiospora hydei]|uniref:Uncharacterized protein n=1 Tax=Apiospora hydei TaxID=1337664 RepID=A0ABR1UV47_9PEZI